jgi:GT2 family glycosyltransferase
LKVSVLIVTYSQHEMLERALDAIDVAAQNIDTETIIVVNGGELLPVHRDAEARGATVLLAPVNLGFPGGLHLARNHARGEYLAIVQDDCLVDDSWFSTLLAVMDADSSVGAVGGCMAALEGDAWGFGLLVARDGQVKVLLEEGPGGDAWAVDACFSAACLVRASAWDSVGGANPRLFPLWMVDDDLGLRLNSADWTVLVVGEALARHKLHGSTNSWLRRYLEDRHRRVLAHDHQRYLATHHDGLVEASEVHATLTQLAAAAARRRAQPPPIRALRPRHSADQLERWARHDARRLRVALPWFRVRSAIGYRARAAVRAVRRISA